jgi:sulfur-oxidizing protein SoxX
MAGKDLDAATRKRVEDANMKTIKFPADGKFIGDWKSGEKIAQGGRGMTYSDKEGAVNGGNCYNCHQISKAEISYGTLGPSLYQYGKLRGDGDAVIKYTWGKLFNAKAYNACTNMPRFGHAGILTEAQMKDLMALLLDPDSPVNK